MKEELFKPGNFVIFEGIRNDDGTGLDAIRKGIVHNGFILTDLGEAYDFNEWDDNLQSIHDAQYNIFQVFSGWNSGESITPTKQIWGESNFTQSTLIWSAVPVSETTSDKIMMKVELEFDVKLNGNPLDINNMSEDERAIIVAFLMEVMNKTAIGLETPESEYEEGDEEEEWDEDDEENDDY